MANITDIFLVKKVLHEITKSQGVYVEPQFHDVMLVFRNICKEHKIDRTLESRCFQILLLLTGDTTRLWGDRIQDAQHYVDIINSPKDNIVEKSSVSQSVYSFSKSSEEKKNTIPRKQDSQSLSEGIHLSSLLNYSPRRTNIMIDGEPQLIVSPQKGSPSNLYTPIRITNSISSPGISTIGRAGAMQTPNASTAPSYLAGRSGDFSDTEWNTKTPPKTVTNKIQNGANNPLTGDNYAFNGFFATTNNGVGVAGTTSSSPKSSARENMATKYCRNKLLRQALNQLLRYKNMKKGFLFSRSALNAKQSSNYSLNSSNAPVTNFSRRIQLYKTMHAIRLGQAAPSFSSSSTPLAAPPSSVPLSAESPSSSSSPFKIRSDYTSKIMSIIPSASTIRLLAGIEKYLTGERALALAQQHQRHPAVMLYLHITSAVGYYHHQHDTLPHTAQYSDEGDGNCTSAIMSPQELWLRERIIQFVRMQTYDYCFRMIYSMMSMLQRAKRYHTKRCLRDGLHSLMQYALLCNKKRTEHNSDYDAVGALPSLSLLQSALSLHNIMPSRIHYMWKRFKSNVLYNSRRRNNYVIADHFSGVQMLQRWKTRTSSYRRFHHIVYRRKKNTLKCFYWTWLYAYVKHVTSSPVAHHTVNVRAEIPSNINCTLIKQRSDIFFLNKATSNRMSLPGKMWIRWLIGTMNIPGILKGVKYHRQRMKYQAATKWLQFCFGDITHWKQNRLKQQHQHQQQGGGESASHSLLFGYNLSATESYRRQADGVVSNTEVLLSSSSSCDQRSFLRTSCQHVLYARLNSSSHFRYSIRLSALHHCVRKWRRKTIEFALLMNELQKKSQEVQFYNGYSIASMGKYNSRRRRRYSTYRHRALDNEVMSNVVTHAYDDRSDDFNCGDDIDTCGFNYYSDGMNRVAHTKDFVLYKYWKLFQSKTHKQKRINGIVQYLIKLRLKKTLSLWKSSIVYSKQSIKKLSAFFYRLHYLYRLKKVCMKWYSKTYLSFLLFGFQRWKEKWRSQKQAHLAIAWKKKYQLQGYVLKQWSIVFSLRVFCRRKWKQKVLKVLHTQVKRHALERQASKCRVMHRWRHRIEINKKQIKQQVKYLKFYSYNKFFRNVLQSVHHTSELNTKYYEFSQQKIYQQKYQYFLILQQYAKRQLNHRWNTIDKYSKMLLWKFASRIYKRHNQVHVLQISSRYARYKALQRYMRRWIMRHARNRKRSQSYKVAILFYRSRRKALSFAMLCNISA